MKLSISNLPAISSLIAFSFLLMTAGCSKDNPSGSGSTSPPSMTASIGGTNFQPSVVAGLDDGTLLTVGGLQVIAGDSVSIAITVPDNTINTALSFSQARISYRDAKGTFDFESGNSPSNGVVKLTSIDKIGLTAGGNFSGVLYNTAKDSVVITNGQFFTTYRVF